MEGSDPSSGLPRFCRGKQHKAAIINDFSGFGRCSLMASIPVLSAMGIQCCPVPTSIFTSHTGFPKFSKLDCTGWMAHYLDDWQAIGLGFEAIQSGYLVSCEQLDFVRDFVSTFRRPGTLVAVDPVMGDYGRLYPSYDPALAARMSSLLDLADVLTPNLTEACLLAGRPFVENPRDADLEALAAALCARHARAVVISGVHRGDALINFCYVKDGTCDILEVPRIGADRSGTGDVFASVILGAMMRGRDFVSAVRIAADFVIESVKRAEAMEIPVTDGLPIEATLPILWS